MKDERAKGVLIDAIELGAIAYWAVVKSYQPDKGIAIIEEIVSEQPFEVGEPIKITYKNIQKVHLDLIIRRAKGEEVGVADWIIADMVCGDIDAIGADVLVQLAVLGEVRYG